MRLRSNDRLFLTREFAGVRKHRIDKLAVLRKPTARFGRSQRSVRMTAVAALQNEKLVQKRTTLRLGFCVGKLFGS